MAVKITDRIVRNIDLPERGLKITSDTVVKGFGVRVTSGGCRSFILRARVSNGRERIITIGRYPDFSVSPVSAYWTD